MMTVTSVEKYKGETFCVIIDGNKRAYLHRDIIERFGISEGAELSHDTLTEILYASDLRRAKRRAMYLINEREYSFIGLFEKLSKNYPERICYDVLSYMTKNGYVDDNRYAEALVYNYMVQKKYGPLRVRQELYKRGIRGSTAERAMEIHAEGTCERLESLIEGKYSGLLEDPGDRKSVVRVKNALARMGYEYGDINSAVNEYLDKRR